MKTMLRSSAFLGLCALFLFACGDDPQASVEDNCSIFCDASTRCQAGAPDKAACMNICREQAKNAAFAEAIALQAECYETATCDQIASGSCDPQDVE